MNAIVSKEQLLAAYKAGEMSTEQLKHLLFSSQPQPLSAGQKGLWALHKALPEITAYQVPLCFHCAQPLDFAALKAACRQVLERYPLLSCVLREEDGEPRLHPLPAERFELRLESVAGQEVQQVLQRLLDDGKRPLPLDGAALIDGCAYQDGEQWWALFRVHHIVFDGTSALLFLSHLLAAYQGQLRREPVVPAEPAAHFAEFVLWQNEMLESERAGDLLAYWQTTLRNAPPPLELATDAQRGGGQEFQGASLRHAVPEELNQRLDAFCASHGLSRAVLFLGVFKGLLSRYTQQQDIIVGMPTLGRPQERFAQSVGYFMNMVPIRSIDIERVDGLDYLNSLQETVVDALDHGDYPFPALIKALKVPRDGRQRPLFNIAFAHQNFAHGHWLRQIEQDYAGPLGITMFEQLRQEGEYELELEIIEGAEGTAINLKYAAALYGRARMERLLTHYLSLLDSVLRHPRRSLADHDIVSEDELALLSRCNASELAIPEQANLLAWLNLQAERHPERIAFSHGDQALNYRDALRGAKALGNYLRVHGIGNGAKVAVCVERSLDLPLAVLGVLHSGAAYVPLDPGYPAERQRYMLEDSGADLLLTQSGIVRDWEPPCGVLHLDDAWERIDAYAETPVPELAAGNAGDLAYLIYTSGSTGRPKGVMVTHGSLNNFLFSMAELLRLSASDRLLAITTFSFDIAGLELFIGLTRGAECMLCEGAVASDAERLKRLIEDSAPTLMQATPTTWQLLFQLGWEPPRQLRALCGGEAMPRALLERFRAAECEVWNLYGPTETTIWSSAKRIEQDAERVTIGSPIGNTQLHILNQYRRLQPLGAAGELAIAGTGLALGYHRMPELTAQKFVDDPFQPGQRMFMTGDNALRLEDGDIRCLGRLDLQVKLRGYRIDVEEIETCIVKHCPVPAAVVVLHPEAQVLVAYLRLDLPPDAAAEQISKVKAELGRHLPPYMVPQRFVCEPDWPMTANGKVDRKALSLQGLPAVANAPAVVAPRSGLAQQVREAWQEALGLRVDDDAGFFDLGGDSVSAVRVAQRLSEQLQRKVTVTQLFEHPTVNRLATALEPSSSEEGELAFRAVASPQHGPLPKFRSGLDAAAAVIGMSCQFAESADLNAFWDNLCQGRACVTRWSEQELAVLGVPERIRRNPQFVPVKAVLEDKHAFDAAFFGLSQRDASFMSPAFKQLLMHAWRAFEDAGYVPEHTPRTAVYLSAGQSAGAAAGDAGQAYLIEDADEYVRWLMSQGGSIPTMISYKLGLTGPSVFLQTNCSSSLVALQAGLESIRSGAADYALVGAATVFPVSMAGYLHQPGLNFSSSGQCRAFDARADGMVGGEGVAMLLLKRASLAMADADPVYAMLREVQVNNDGALKAGFFAPSVAGQAEVIRQTLKKAGVEPGEVGYIETHGTGTSLGDPVEFAALDQAYGQGGQAQPFCGLGSVKSNIGHTDTAAGLAGSIKAILSLARQHIPPSLHLDSPNSQLKLERSPFYLVDQLRPWPDTAGQTRYAAVSSFGVGGTNAHALFSSVAERPEPAGQTDSLSCLVVLSAKTEDKRREAARQLLDFVSGADPSLRLADLAYTLQLGRKAWPQRLALVARDLEDLRRLLRLSLDGGDDAALYQGQAGRGDAPGAAALEDDDLHHLARVWVAGATVDWTKLHAARPARRIHLPTYPFITERERRSMQNIAQNIVAPDAVAADAVAESGHALHGVACWVREAAPKDAGAVAGKLAVLAREADMPPGFDLAWHIDPARYPDEAALAEALGQRQDLEELIWLVPLAPSGDLSTMLAEQEHGVFWGASLLRALVQAGYHERELRLTVATRRSVAIADQDPLTATHGGVHGLVGSVVKEHLHWQARLADLEDLSELPAALALPFERSGRLWARRGGDWFRPAMHQLEDSLLNAGAPAYRRGGVYVIVGGAGAIGQDLSDYLVAHYQAQLVWIGRQAPDAVKPALARLGLKGPAPLYLQADATDLAQLQKACDEIRRRFPVVHGVVHSAMARENQALHRQPADDFRRGVAVKAAIAVNLARIYQDEALDFLLFFSSINMSYLAANSAAYAAGGGFISALADQLNQRGRACAKVVYWGHWETDALRDDVHGVRRHLARAGFGVVRPEEGMRLLEVLLRQPFKHLASFRLTHDQAQEALHFSGLSLGPKQREPLPGFDAPPPHELEQTQRLIDISYGRLAEIDALLRTLLWRQIDAFLDEAGFGASKRRGRYDLSSLDKALGERHYLLRWLRASLKILEANEEVTLSGERLILSSALEERAQACWPRWQTVKDELEHDPFMSSVSRFIDVAIQAIPDVLGGRKKATEVFFSNSSMALVESIYKENPVVHYYGAVVGRQAAEQIRAILAARPEARIRLLEVGAGTGSCTEHVLAAIKPFAANIEEYCFTDLSQLFLQRAERRYRAEHPYLTTKIFNAENDPQAQGLSAESFDVVIAANVIHATQDIRVTARHIQSLMRANGNFLLLELTENSLFSHLTFGLLEGWWRFSDPELRMPFGPALSAAAWRSVLFDQGFSSVSFPCDALTGSDLQVVAARGAGFSLGPQGPERFTLPAATQEQPMPGREPFRPAKTALSAAAANLDGVRDVLAQILAESLGGVPGEIDGDESLGDYGLDSIIGIKLVQQINAKLGLELVAGVLFEFNTLNRLAAHVAGLSGGVIGVAMATAAPVGGTVITTKVELAEASVPEPPIDQAPASGEAAAPSSGQDIAIIGMSAQFPGANSVEEFWRNIEAGVDCIVEVDAERWDWRRYYGKNDGFQALTESRWGGFIDNVYHFDPLFFDLSPYEAALMDPQQRLLLKHSWLAIEDAGIAHKRFSEERTGVFMAVGASEYAITTQLPVGNPLVASSISSAMVANRISHLLNLRGPSEHYDTGCSSSLVALHRAMQSMANGECRQALVGGVQLVLSPLGAINLDAAGFLSHDGKSRSFQAGSDGFVRAEGVGVLVLKPLHQARADHDEIYAVLKGSGVAHGGKGLSLTAPNAHGMKEAMSQALQRAGVEPASLSYIETHGIASQIGDSIEMQALHTVFGGSGGEDCVLSSLKPVIGHTEIASGIAAVIKTALALRQRRRPGVPGFAEASKHLPSSLGRLSIQAAMRDWPAPGVGQPRRAGVNSFGFGGVNGFAVLEEYAAAPAVLPQDAVEPQLLLLSARHEQELRRNAAALLAYLQDLPALNLPQLASSLWRKNVLPARLALVAENAEQAISRLRSFVDSEPGQAGAAPGCHYGNQNLRSNSIGDLLGSSAGGELLQKLREQGDYPRLARLWVDGVHLEMDPRLAGLPRLRLPAHVFDERVCKLPALAEGFRQPSLSPTGEQAVAEPVPVSMAVEYAEPEAQLRSMLASLLQLAPDEIDFQQPLARYGIDSLTAVMLQNRIAARYGERIALAQLLGCGNFAELAGLLPSQPPGSETVAPGLPAPERHLPSVGQQGLWIEQRFNLDLSGYNIPYAFRASGKAAPERLFAAARASVGRHSLLSANFQLEDEQLWLCRGKPAQPRCLVHVLDDGVSLDEQLNAVAREPFDLSSDSLLRVDVFVPAAEQDGTILLLTFHHAVFDGSSLPIFLSTFFACYESEDEGAGALPPESDYSEFVDWQRQWLAGAEGEKARRFWHARLSPRAEPLRLLGQQTAQGGARMHGLLKQAVPAGTLQGLASLAERLQLSSYSLMLAALGMLLGWHGNRRRVNIATPFFGRPQARFEELAGYFVNLLVMPVETPEAGKVADWLPRLQAQLLEALEHGHYPYPLLQQELSQAGRPLYDVVFLYQNWVRAAQRRLADRARQWRPLPDIQQRMDFELAFEVYEGEEGSILCCHFDPAVYPEPMMRQLQNDYLALLAQLPDMARAEDDAAKNEREARVEEAAGQESLIALFERQAARNPERTALICGEQSLSYEALNQRANRIARRLSAYATKGGVVGLLLEPGFDFVASTLACWKLGMAYLALDGDLPAERLAYMAADSACRVVLTHRADLENMQAVRAALAAPLLDLDVCASELAAQDGANLAPAAFQALSYVIYTSGSSGKPKGVKGSQRGTLNRLRWGWRQFPYAPDEVCCQKTSLNFVDHVAELFAPLLQGVPSVILADRLFRDRGASAFAQALARHRVSRLLVIPSLLQALLQDNVAAEALAGLRYCFSSGESLPADVAKVFRRCCPGGELVNIYGSSEMSADASFKIVAAGEEEAINIGLPLDNVHIVIADDQDRACAAGVTGQLLVAGDALALGYLGQSEEEERRFAYLDPDGQGSRRYFRSGDLGHWLANGEIVLAGRHDQQLKINGQRIEPGEIEAALRGHEQVVEALVRLDADQSGLEAFVAARGELDARTLREHLGRSLPQALLPQRFYQLEQLPRLASGKLDRRGVTAEVGRLLPYERYAVGSGLPSEREQRLLREVERIAQLPVGTVGLDQDFFQLGFDSFRFIRLAEALGDAFSVKASPADFYRHATPRKWLESQGLAAMPAAAPAELPVGDEPIAVVGMAGVFPGADDLDSFWQQLRDGADLISETPAERWRWQDYAGQPGGEALRWGGFIKDIDKFSPAFFGLSPLEAEFMDPQHRVFLESAWHALEDAGYPPRSLPERDVGVFVGVSSMDYAGKLMLSADVDPLANFGNGHSMLANRVSYLLNLTGPSLAIDTACSSSLVAIHEAIKAIRSGDCRWALAGGVNILLEPRVTQAMGKARMLSSQGRCKTFSSDADGYVRGEGAGVLVLKTLKQALADRDQIHGVIRASGVNHGGRSNSMTAPNPQAQSDLICQVYRRAGIQANQVSYIETHGTGTPIGDPIEVNALKEAWQRVGKTSGTEARCALGAVKSNIGHLEAAAGIAGAIKTLLCLKHRTLVKNLHGDAVNEHINLRDSPFYLLQDSVPWPSQDGKPRLAGLSSFGIGGTNAHLLFEEFIHV